MVDLRFLGLSLMAVFLALAIGLMIGSALGGPDKREAAYQRVQEQFDLLRAENQRVREEGDLARRRLESRSQALRDLLPRTVEGRLSGTRVAVILCGGGDERRYWGDLETTLRTARAEWGPIVRVGDKPGRPSAEARSRFSNLLAPDPPSDTEDPFEYVAWLVRGMTRGEAPELMESLCREAGFQARGLDRLPVRRLLLLSTRPLAERAELPPSGSFPELVAADTARREGMIVVAAESEELEPSLVDLLGRRDITTVDNVDTYSGQMAVVLALAGQKGRFGSKPGSVRAIPALASP
ncbi:MAG: hypothetical protein FJX77_12035 [Armatimonadetes bacterium]|nr:hypothetical protein [Armatimonadota bacterium]